MCPRLQYTAGIGSLIGISLLQATVMVLRTSVYLYHGHLVQIDFCAKTTSFEPILRTILQKSVAMIFHIASKILFSLQQRDAFLQSPFSFAFEPFDIGTHLHCVSCGHTALLSDR
jgi:hypothetical protein